MSKIRPTILDKLLLQSPEVFERTFDRMVIADDEISKAMERWPEQSDHFDGDGFSLCRPSPVLEDATEKIYRVHCAEILDRLAQAQDTSFATDAEVLWSLCQLSLKSPLTPDASVAYERLFKKIFEADAIPNLPQFRESFDGAVDEIVSKLRVKLTINDRRVI